LFSPSETAINKFPMSESWQPTEKFTQSCRFRGINLIGFSPDDQDDLINEFRSYWMTQNTQLNQSGWEHKLVASLKRSKERKATQEKQSADMDWDDLSWAENLNEGLI
jgi:hypothetical protein